MIGCVDAHTVCNTVLTIVSERENRKTMKEFFAETALRQNSFWVSKFKNSRAAKGMAFCSCFFLALLAGTATGKPEEFSAPMQNHMNMTSSSRLRSMLALEAQASEESSAAWFVYTPNSNAGPFFDGYAPGPGAMTK